MFSTFTGNSRRPRNVNLSGAAGNPFTNTSWTPAAASNATKTVTNAQADRERRQVERRKLKAAKDVQRVWRGHVARCRLADSRRTVFDDLPAYSEQTDSERLTSSMVLLLSFFSIRRPDDLDRLFRLASALSSLNIGQSGQAPQDVHRLLRFLQILLAGIKKSCEGSETQVGSDLERLAGLLRLAARLFSSLPQAPTTLADDYYDMLVPVLHTLLGIQPDSDALLRDMVVLPLQVADSSTVADQTCIYSSLAYRLLSQPSSHTFQSQSPQIAQTLNVSRLCSTVYSTYGSATLPENGRLWLLAHLIGLLDCTHEDKKVVILATLQLQLSALSELVKEGSFPDPYIHTRICSLVDQRGIDQLVKDISSEASSTIGTQKSAAPFAAYTLTLLSSFPSQADDIRMRLLLSTPDHTRNDPSSSIVKYFWREVCGTRLFTEVQHGAETSLKVMHQLSQQDMSKDDQHGWTSLLMFLGLYIFVLRISDDDDFFSQIQASPFQDAQPLSQVRKSSLGLDDLLSLTTFLKNASYVLHYHAHRLQSSRPSQSHTTPVAGVVDLDELRALVTTAVKMLYERDSRKQFLPQGHWLMPTQLPPGELRAAVIMEDQRQAAEDASTDEDEDSAWEAELESRVLTNPYARAERMRLERRRKARDHRLAESGPKLEVLRHIPFVVPFDTRVEIFREFIRNDIASRHQLDARGFDMGGFQAKHDASIRRGSLFEDAYESFYPIGDGLKDLIRITFVDQFGEPEPGIDGGGVTKEFLTSVTMEAFERGNMFVSNEKGLLYPDPTAVDVLRHSMKQHDLPADSQAQVLKKMLQRYEFLGRIIGKCLYEGILVDLIFAGFFLLQWPSSGEKSTYKGSVNDLKDMDEELYRGLMRLKNYSGDFSELDTNFTIEDQITPKGEATQTVTRNLIPNGDQTSVTMDNRLLYISYVARHRLVAQGAAQTAAFLRGLRQIIKPHWLSMFNQVELQRLVGGDSTEIDVEDLRRNTYCSGIYEVGDDGLEHPTVALFWKVLKEDFTDAQRRDVLKYVTSTPRAPLLGFSQLVPRFSIRDAGTDETRLPSASTCVNLLKLPRYKTRKVLREKLLYAVSSGAGFDLS